MKSLIKRLTPHNKWDIFVRLIHWSVAGLFLANYYYTDPGYEAHTNVGWAILWLVGFRLLWGLTFAKGLNHLRNFLPTLSGAQHHINQLKTRQKPTTLGHNSFGSCAVYLLWLGLAAASFTGWLQDTDWGFDNGVDAWHRQAVDWLYILIIVHVCAVILTSLWLRVNLTRAMITGRLKN